MEKVIRFVYSGVFICSGLFLGATAAAQFATQTDIPDPLKVSSVTVAPAELEPGQTAEVKLDLVIENGFHAYVEQFKLEKVEPRDAHLSEFQVTPTVKFTDPLTKKEKIGTTGLAQMVSLLEIPKQGLSGTQTLKMELTYQACTKEFCLFPRKIPVEAEFKVTGGAGGDMLTQALDKGFIYALIFVFIGGFLTSLTPCIFPMIPITLAVLGTKDTGRSRLKGLSLSLTYVMGIALTYSTLGVIAAKSGAMFGALLGHPLVVSALALIFVAMGLSMLGLYEIQVPAFISNRLGRKRFEQNYAGAFLSGMLAGVVASPCVGPVLISVLAYVAQTQNTVIGFTLLFTFALGLGQLFIVLGTFQSILSKLPRSGPWMDFVKNTFGVLMIGVALYFVYPVAHNALFDALISSALIFLAIFFGAFRRGRKLSDIRRAAAMITLVFGLLFFAKALIPEHVSQKLLPATGAKADYAKPEWHRYSEELLVKAAQEGRPVIIDFKAEWCLACKELEHYTFSDAKVMEFGKAFLWLDFDATKPSPELEVLQKKYGIAGLPYVTFYDGKGSWRKDLTLFGFEEAAPFLERMQKVTAE